jgi:RimJ/RimL family protein N-acetyltransferase
MAIVYTTNWHNDRKPRLVLKGLYINEWARGQGVGSALLKAVANFGLELGVSKIAWVVLKDNKAAEKFYMAHGAKKESDWDVWLLNQVAFSELAD